MDTQTAVSGLENPFIGSFQQNGANSDSLLKSLQDDQLKSIREAIADINALIVERQHLNAEMFAHIDRVKMDLSNFLLEDSSKLSIAEKLEVREKIAGLEELKIAERLNAWRDIANLKRELRERLKELTERESRADIIDQILEN